MDAVKLMGETIVKTAELTADQDSIGCAKLVVFANAVEDNPFMAGAFHGVGEPDTVINVGVSGPGVVKVALEACKGQPFDVVADTIKKLLSKLRGWACWSPAKLQKTGHAFRYRRSFSGSDAGGGRQHRQSAGRNRPGGLRRSGHHRGPGHAQRRGEKRAALWRLLMWAVSAARLFLSVRMKA